MSITERADGRPGAGDRGRGGGPDRPDRGPPLGPPLGPGAEPGPGREPMFRAPWPVLAMAAAILGAYACQSFGGDSRGVVETFGFAPSRLAQGRAGGLLTAMFVHASWPHALINTLAMTAFGAPVLRALDPQTGGARPAQAAAFFVFYLVCGVLAALGFAAVHPGQPTLLVGASGAVSGLMGAASRIRPGAPGLAPLTQRGVIVMAVVWALANLALGLVGVNVGAGDAPLAWEAHIAGYAAGLLLIGPLVRLASPRI